MQPTLWIDWIIDFQAMAETFGTEIPKLLVSGSVCRRELVTNTSSFLMNATDTLDRLDYRFPSNGNRKDSIEGSTHCGTHVGVLQLVSD